MKKQVYIFIVAIVSSFYSVVTADIQCLNNSGYSPVYKNISPYTATYDLRKDGEKIGKAHRSLQSIDEDNWQLSMDSQASYFLIKFKYFQESKFSWLNCRPQPDSYIQTSINNFKPKRINTQQFDWSTMLETGSYKNNNWQTKLTPEIQDRQTSLINLRLKLLSLDINRNKTDQQPGIFRYPVSYKGKVNDDVYKIIGEERLSTGAGDFLTLKFEKIHTNHNRISYFWLARKLDYIPIRIRQLKGGKEQADMLLKSIVHK